MLEDMIYSGDMSGFVRRKSREILNEDFLDFLKDKIDTVENSLSPGGDVNEDEREDTVEEFSVLRGIETLLESMLRQTDGLQDSEQIFEARLDRILFAPPNQRRAYMEEGNLDGSFLTEGFVEHVKRELRGSPDQDSKVVLASVLQLISSILGQQQQQQLTILDAEAESLLKRADASLGDQFITRVAAQGEGGLVLGGGETPSSQQQQQQFPQRGGGGGGISVSDRNEQILAGLMYSENDILEDVLNNVRLTQRDLFLFYLLILLKILIYFVPL
jgi:hypothetical protein